METRNASREPAWLVDGSEEFAPVGAPHEDVMVEIDLDWVFPKFIRLVYNRLIMAVEIRGGTLSITEEEVLRYCTTLIDSRVKYCMRFRNGVPPVVDKYTPAAVPTALEKILSLIGRVKVPEYGITFLPTFQPTVELMTVSEFNVTTQKLQTIMLSDGITFGEVAYDKNPEGNVDFMSMQVLRNATGSPGVYSHEKMAPCYAVLAFVVGLHQINSLMGARVFYAHEQVLEEHLIRLAAA